MATTVSSNNMFWVSPTTGDSSVDLDAYVGRHEVVDPAFITFKLDLMDYLLCILWGVPGVRAQQPKAGPGGESGQLPAFTDAQRELIIINRNLLHRHDTLYVQYTAYNGYPTLGIIDLNHRDFMVHNIEGMGDRTGRYGDYRFAHLIEIFHVLVKCPRTRSMHKVTMLFVRWYIPEMYRFCTDPVNSDMPTYCPRRLKFLRADHPEAFGFLDPTQVIRPVDIVPDLSSGRSYAFLGRSSTRYTPNSTDFNYYNVNCMFDHDLFFRLHLPSGVFHFLRALIRPERHIALEYYSRATPTGRGVDAFALTKTAPLFVEENSFEEVDFVNWESEDG